MECEHFPLFSRRQKIATTIGIYFGNVCLALGMNAYSPAVVEFANKYEVSVEDVAIVFTVLTFSYMVGALLASFIFRFLNRQLGVILCLSGIGTALYLTPHCPTITTLYVLAGPLGVCNGLYDASQVVWVIEMWQVKAPPFIQGQHFFFAVGSLLPSVLLGPFLSKADPSPLLPKGAAENSVMWIPFTIAGVIVTLAAALQIYLFVFQRYLPPPSEVRTEQQVVNGKTMQAIETKETNYEIETTETIDENRTNLWLSPKYLKVTLIVLSANFLGFYQGMEMVTMQFISTFAQFGEHNLSEAEGARVMTALTGSYAIGRGLGIFIILKIGAQIILGGNLLLIIISSVALLVFGNSTFGLWASVALLGIGFSTVYPSYCAYIERHLVFTNAVGSIMLVSGSLVASIFPIVIGKQIEENANVLVYANLFCALVTTFALIAVLKLTYRRKHKSNKSTSF